MSTKDTIQLYLRLTTPLLKIVNELHRLKTAEGRRALVAAIVDRLRRPSEPSLFSTEYSALTHTTPTCPGCIRSTAVRLSTLKAHKRRTPCKACASVDPVGALAAALLAAARTRTTSLSVPALEALLDQVAVLLQSKELVRNEEVLRILKGFTDAAPVTESAPLPTDPGRPFTPDRPVQLARRGPLPGIDRDRVAAAAGPRPAPAPAHASASAPASVPASFSSDEDSDDRFSVMGDDDITAGIDFDDLADLLGDADGESPHAASDVFEPEDAARVDAAGAGVEEAKHAEGPIEDAREVARQALRAALAESGPPDMVVSPGRMEALANHLAAIASNDRGTAGALAKHMVEAETAAHGVCASIVRPDGSAACGEELRAQLVAIMMLRADMAKMDILVQAITALVAKYGPAFAAFAILPDAAAALLSGDDASAALIVAAEDRARSPVPEALVLSPLVQAALDLVSPLFGAHAGAVDVGLQPMTTHKLASVLVQLAANHPGIKDAGQLAHLLCVEYRKHVIEEALLSQGVQITASPDGDVPFISPEVFRDGVETTTETIPQTLSRLLALAWLRRVARLRPTLTADQEQKVFEYIRATVLFVGMSLDDMLKQILMGIDASA